LIRPRPEDRRATDDNWWKPGRRNAPPSDAVGGAGEAPRRSATRRARVKWTVGAGALLAAIGCFSCVALVLDHTRRGILQKAESEVHAEVRLAAVQVANIFSAIEYVAHDFE